MNFSFFISWHGETKTLPHGTNFGTLFSLVICSLCHLCFTPRSVQASEAQRRIGTHGSVVTVVLTFLCTALPWQKIALARRNYCLVSTTTLRYFCRSSYSKLFVEFFRVFFFNVCPNSKNGLETNRGHRVLFHYHLLLSLLEVSNSNGLMKKRFSGW